MIKLVVSDIDGVWTDGGFIHDDSGRVAKRFCTSDSVGVSLLRHADIPLLIVSGENSKATECRMKKFSIDSYSLGVKRKYAFLNEYLVDRGLCWDEVAFIGDEVNDFKVFENAGYTACPHSAPSYIKEIASLVTPSSGGYGAFRDFVIALLKEEDKFSSAWKKQLLSYE